MPPIHLLVKPASSLCNMRCRYCFYADVAANRSVPSYGIMDADTQEAMVRAVFAFAEGHCTFAFQGGEPTLAGLAYFERLVALVAQYNTRRIPVHYAMQTNGLLIDGEWAAFLRKHRFLIGLSLDGDAALHNVLRPDAAGKGTYNRVMAAAQMLQKHGCDYNILCVVTKEAARHGARVYGQLKRHRFLQFIPCIDAFDAPPGEDALTSETYLRFLKAAFDGYYHDFMAGQYTSVRLFDNYVQMLMGNAPDSCAMRGQCAISPVVEGDGSVYPCDFYVLDEWRMGNVHDDALSDMLTSTRAKLFVQSSGPEHPRCEGCQWLALCRGGCRRDRPVEMDETLGLNRFCEAYDGFFAYAIDRLQEIARIAARNR